jgi:(E)-4-hydroxy-3-methylbut-2-enyl-diphosphate synthase
MPVKRKIIPYNPKLKELAKTLRKNMTLSEVLLWNELKHKSMFGYDFDRQRPVGEYIVDFFCKELSLAIEIDGDTHIYRSGEDEERQKELEKIGVRFLRFEDIEVKRNMGNVLRVIGNWIEKNQPTPAPSREGINAVQVKPTSKQNKPTPAPSGEGINAVQVRSTGNQNQLTPAPSREGINAVQVKTISRQNKPTPAPSQKGISSVYRSVPVYIGSVSLGGDNPIRLQSMTNTDTLDTRASVAQCIRIVEAGADFVRLTAQGVREAENLDSIKKELHKAGFSNPLIADIHFNPAAAETAARIVEKVRINPGNYADKRAAFIKSEFTDKEYSEELERIHSRLLPLINICRDNSTVIRIGINHGSLSDRIMTRYGNTPEGMVMSAMEFIRIFMAENFRNIVLSMKSSDTAVVVESNRLLVDRMTEEKVAFPIHLGVTEAGEGEDGRVRSAAGIGALLAEGIGDTVRVSLSEDPENEIPVAREIVDFICGNPGRIKVPAERVGFITRTTLYRPEVLSDDRGKIKDEAGRPFTQRMHSFAAGKGLPAPSLKDGSLILNPVFNEDDPVKLSIDAAALAGRYFIMKQAEGICISNKGKVQGAKLRDLSFSILQSTEARITRNRYISCPTCGRTKFDLQEAVRKVKEATGHLTGLKIAVMGCIVNGPGEMAGADYGYVGAGEGKVHIYRGIEPVLKNVPVEDAVGELLKLINSDNKA